MVDFGLFTLHHFSFSLLWWRAVQDSRSSEMKRKLPCPLYGGRRNLWRVPGRVGLRFAEFYGPNSHTITSKRHTGGHFSSGTNE
uniref:Putative secreted protein n=1 Tax=Anopheles marajoara TaxID=58244 RepID=A0A2M4CAZ1_9DIPT